MIRKAILLINSARNDDKKFDVNFQAVNYHTEQISKTLESLGDYSFEVNKIIDKKYNDAKTELNVTLEQFANNHPQLLTEDDSCLLFYYFGHAVDRGNDLHFIFKNSDQYKSPTCLQFSQLSRDIFGYGFKNVIIILDCCYSGVAVQYVPPDVLSNSNYAFLCSAIQTNKAFTATGKTPFGVFSTFLFSNLKRPLATRTRTGDITIRTLFDDTKSMISNNNPQNGPVLGYKQTPKLSSQNLEDFVLAKSKAPKSIISRANDRAPIKSYYSKYRWIGNQIFGVGSIGFDELYYIVQRDRPDEFLTPVKKGEITTYEPIKDDTFDTYIFGMKTLKILSTTNNDNLELSDLGRSMFSNGQGYFNDVLLELIKDQFAQAGMDIDQLDYLLQYRMNSRQIPLSSGIFKDAKSLFQLNMNSTWFGIMLDLLSYIGFLRITTRKTYYPYF